MNSLLPNCLIALSSD